MIKLGKKMVVSASAAMLLGAGVVMGAAPVQAQWGPSGCSAYPINNTSAYSQCYWPVRHQVRIECRHWWGWFGSSWATYERRGPIAWDGQQSWAHCDFPGTLQRWDVVTYWW
ncbi:MULTISPECIES: hypothetical protein [unclassified Nocardia]|uniref:hypothetical protein n=1 Tax=unclassified Nocardia TaxID=2637762 RepID=UPI0033BDDF91